MLYAPLNIFSYFSFVIPLITLVIYSFILKTFTNLHNDFFRVGS